VWWQWRLECTASSGPNPLPHLRQTRYERGGATVIVRNSRPAQWTRLPVEQRHPTLLSLRRPALKLSGAASPCPLWSFVGASGHRSIL
jgi:hypothetical protein